MDRNTRTNLYMILLLGIVLICFTVIFTRNLVTGAKTNDAQEQTIIGSSGHVAKQIATLVEVCWNKNEKGESEKLDICYKVELNLQDPYAIKKSLIANYLEMEKSSFEMPKELTMRTASFDIRYIPGNSSKVMIN